MSGSMVQIQIDDNLLNDAGNIYNRLGVDLPTAVSIFLKRSVIENGFPFEMRVTSLPNIEDVRSSISPDISNVLQSMADCAKKTGSDKMSLDEINTEISFARERR